jgi:S1-C subfamily serine protease
MSEDIEYWYVRDGNSVTGPFTRAELDEQRAAGTLLWSHEVSQDQIIWVSASTLPPSGPRESPRKAKKRKKRRLILVMASGGAVAILLLGWTFWGAPETEPIAPEKPRQPQVGPITSDRRPPPPVIRSVEAEGDLSSAVGFVVCALSLKVSGREVTQIPAVTGTCFLVSQKGYLLTNRHVIEGLAKLRDSEAIKDIAKKPGVTVEPEVWVFFFKRPENILVKKAARIVFQTDSPDEVDLAVLKIDLAPEPLPPYFRLAPRGSEDHLKIKDVYALGFPSAARLPIFEKRDPSELFKPGMKVEDLFRESDFDYVAERGIVNVVRKESSKSHKVVEWILHGAKISPGNSGGPLITRDATVIGINTLVQKSLNDGVTNYFALGMSPIREELGKHVPEIQDELADSGGDLDKERPGSSALDPSSR